jgi:26S proteasome regulatory subunit N7
MEETNKDELDRVDERLKEAEKREGVNEISDVLNARTSSYTYIIRS